MTRSTVLASASVAVFVGSLIWAWATSDYWETIPMVPCVVGAGVLAAAASYVHRRRLWVSLGIGIAVTLVTFVATGTVGFSRWGR
jgi:hypothetical protein